MCSVHACECECVAYMHVLVVFTGYVHAIVDLIICCCIGSVGDEGVTGLKSWTGDIATVCTAAVRELIFRVEACVADDRPVVADMYAQAVFLHNLVITPACVRRVTEPRAGLAGGLLGHPFVLSTYTSIGVPSVMTHAHVLTSLDLYS